MPKTTKAPTYAIAYTPFFGTRDGDLAERAQFSLTNALYGYYADHTDATTDETIGATNLALHDHVTDSRATVNITSAELDEYLRVIRGA